MISIEYFFILSGLLFFIGVFGFITRRNLVAMLISVSWCSTPWISTSPPSTACCSPQDRRA